MEGGGLFDAGGPDGGGIATDGGGLFEGGPLGGAAIERGGAAMLWYGEAAGPTEGGGRLEGGGPEGGGLVCSQFPEFSNSNSARFNTREVAASTFRTCGGRSETSSTEAGGP